VLNLVPEGLAPQNMLAPLLMVGGVVMLGVLLTFSIRGRIARRNRDRPTPREMIDRIKSRQEQADDVHAATSRLTETARKLSAQLDNKARRLEVLLQEADARIAALAGSASRPEPAAEPAAPAPTNGARPAAPASPPPLDPLTRSVYEHSDAGLTALEIAQQLDEQVGKVELILALRDA
jgi:hypothetical protein